MGLDIRLPIGLMFSLLGAVLTIYGAISDPQIYQRSLGHNVNLWWGLVLLVFGVIFTYYGHRATKILQANPRPASSDAERDVPGPHGH